MTETSVPASLPQTRDINQGTIEQDRLDFLENDNLFSDLAD